MTYDEVFFKENYFADIALAGSAKSENEEYMLNYDKLPGINKALTKQDLDIIFMDTLFFNMDRRTHNYCLQRDKETGEII